MNKLCYAPQRIKKSLLSEIGRLNSKKLPYIGFVYANSKDLLEEIENLSNEETVWFGRNKIFVMDLGILFYYLDDEIYNAENKTNDEICKMHYKMNEEIRRNLSKLEKK